MPSRCWRAPGLAPALAPGTTNVSATGSGQTEPWRTSEDSWWGLDGRVAGKACVRCMKWLLNLHVLAPLFRMLREDAPCPRCIRQGARHAASPSANSGADVARLSRHDLSGSRPGTGGE